MIIVEVTLKVISNVHNLIVFINLRNRINVATGTVLPKSGLSRQNRDDWNL